MKKSFAGTWCTACLILAILSLNGCAHTPLDEQAGAESPVSRPGEQGEAPGTAAVGGERWWSGFDDPGLSGQIDLAFRTNKDPAATAMQVLRAQLNERLGGADGPGKRGTADGAGRGGTGLPPKPLAGAGAASYERELWSKLAGALDDADWEAGMSEADRQSTELALVGMVASLYWRTAFINEGIAAVQRDIADAERLQELVDRKFAADSATVVEQIKGRQALADLRIELTRLLERRSQARQVASLLFREVPESSLAERHRLPEGELPAIPAGLPASLLAQRPDLRAAEQGLSPYFVKADASVTLYPALALTDAKGECSTQLLGLLRNPDGVLGTGAVLPFLDRRSVRLLLDHPNPDFEKAIATFRSALHSALQDVATALTVRSTLIAERARLNETLQAARSAEGLAEAKYRAHALPVQALLEAREARRSQELRLATNRLNRLKNRMAIHLAVGGSLRPGE